MKREKGQNGILQKRNGNITIYSKRNGKQNGGSNSGRNENGMKIP
jgi:hypothetical protein